LPEAGRIAIHSVGQGEVGFYSPTRRPDAQLVDHLLQDRLQIDLSPVREREAAAEAAARKSRTLSIRSDIRTTLGFIKARICSPLSLKTPADPTFLAAGAFVSLASVWPSEVFAARSSMLLAGLLNGAIVAFPNKRD
jgi:hypothetical protein